jgi:hypothetical protein
MLLYFAADMRRKYHAWSAISRPPYFTALALWPTFGTHGGGGLFLSRNQIGLDYQDWQDVDVAKEFSVPSWLTVGRLGCYAGGEEFEPSKPWSVRLKRDGWKLTDYPRGTKDEFGKKVWVEYDPPVTWQKYHPLWPEKYTLQMSILGLHEQKGPFYLIDHSVIGMNGYVGIIGRSEWAEWSHTGDLLFSQSGCLYRLRPENGVFGPIEASKQIADFSGLEFQRCEAPESVQVWPPR